MPAKTIAEKLQIKPGTTFWASDEARAERLAPLPDGVREVGGPADAAVAVVFADDAASLRDLLAVHGGRLTAPGTVWVAYPKGNKTDINRDTLWPLLTEHGLRPNGQVAIDEVWSALRFRATRPGEAPFTGGKG
jgi:hypothetical protein